MRDRQFPQPSAGLAAIHESLQRSVDVVRTQMTLGYQHLVVDRGSIGAYDVLFER